MPSHKRHLYMAFDMFKSGEYLTYTTFLSHNSVLEYLYLHLNSLWFLNLAVHAKEDYSINFDDVDSNF